jgi:putative flippase GtrA
VARFVRFNLVALISLVVTASTASALVWQTSVHYLLANLVGIALATTCNLVLNVGWTWRGVWRGEPSRP